MLGRRCADATICPSEAARAIGGDAWRNTMPVVHAAVRALAHEGVVEVRQRGEVRDPVTVVGAYRIATAKV